jgi:hypothetical protein
METFITAAVRTSNSTQTEDVSEQGAEETILTKER